MKPDVVLPGVIELVTYGFLGVWLTLHVWRSCDVAVLPVREDAGETSSLFCLVALTRSLVVIKFSSSTRVVMLRPMLLIFKEL